MTEIKEYRIVVMDGKIPLFLRTLRIWPDELLATEMQGQMIGKELARDAIHHAGLFDAFLKQRGKVA
jgi:hypothetical protein